MTRSEHWNGVYTSKREGDVSWFEATPAVSLQLLEAAGLDSTTRVLDVGGGDSHLVDELIARGLRAVTVLDVSAAAVARARARLGAHGDVPAWIAADVTGDWSAAPVDVWHDRAVFHFLTAAEDRARYREHLLRVLKPGGTAIVATFAPDGPERCSGLPVMRYSPDALAAELGHPLTLVDSRLHTHWTPWGTGQAFQYSRFRRG
jgi:SAM-dependent methyltransferase